MMNGFSNPISLDDLKNKLRQVEAKDSNLRPNQTPFGANDMHNGVAGLTHMDGHRGIREGIRSRP